MQVVKATDVKWEQGDHDAKNAAHTAPKSQKYWDMHGIERPDYAKTDAEIEQERGESGGGVMKWIFLLLMVAAAGYYYFLQTAGGQSQKLGGSTSHLFRRTSEEQARQARLAKFERGMGSGKAE